MPQQILILGGDLFSIVTSKVLAKLGHEVIWVSDTNPSCPYRKSLNEALACHDKLGQYLNYLNEEPETPIQILKDARLLNLLDNGINVDIRLKVQGRIQQYKVDQLIAINRKFHLHKRLQIDYVQDSLGQRLRETRISLCHMIGEVTFLYFDEEQIDLWFQQLNHFIRISGQQKRQPTYTPKVFETPFPHLPLNW